MKNIFISIPVEKRNELEILTDLQAATDAVQKIFPESKIYSGNFLASNAPVFLKLSKDLYKLTLCEAVYFCSGWENDKNCKILHYICEEYGIQRIEV